MEINVNQIQKSLQALAEAKTSLAKQTASEITRLTVIINRLSRIPKLQSIVETVVQESSKQIN